MILGILTLAVQIKWNPPYQVVEKPANVSSYVQKLKGKTQGIFVDRDVMTMISRGKANSLLILDWYKAPFTYIADQDAWVSQTRMKDWNQAFFQYTVKDGSGKTTPDFFRGAKAPKMPTFQNPLKGTVTEYTLKSEALAEDRKIFVYLPPDAPKNIPFIVMADGAACTALAQVVEPEILAKRIRPVAIVGVPNGGYRGGDGPFDMAKDFRAKEYLKMFDPERFSAHLKFVCDEVIPWAREKFELSTKFEETAVFGFSNGGAFAFAAAIDRPDVFGLSFACSIAATDIEGTRAKSLKDVKTKFYVQAGTLEVFIKNTTALHEILTAKGIESHLRVFVSGHEFVACQIGLVDNLKTLFPVKRN